MKVELTTEVNIPVTDDMVDRVAAVMEEYDWLPNDWDSTFDADDYKCKCCGKLKDGDGDGGAATKAVIRVFLETALEIV